MNYRVNMPRVAHETLDDETIIIDFEQGTYYSLSDVANWVWFLLEKEQTVEHIVTQIITYFTGEQEEIDAAVRQFIGQLAHAGLIIRTDTPPSLTIPLPLCNQMPFMSPQVEVHTDIQDLLLLDPIHEVGRQGWPLRN